MHALWLCYQCHLLRTLVVQRQKELRQRPCCAFSEGTRCTTTVPGCVVIWAQAQLGWHRLYHLSPAVGHHVEEKLVHTWCCTYLLEHTRICHSSVRPGQRLPFLLCRAATPLAEELTRGDWCWPVAGATRCGTAATHISAVHAQLSKPWHKTTVALALCHSQEATLHNAELLRRAAIWLCKPVTVCQETTAGKTQHQCWRPASRPASGPFIPAHTSGALGMPAHAPCKQLRHSMHSGGQLPLSAGRLQALAKSTTNPENFNPMPTGCCRYVAGMCSNGCCCAHHTTTKRQVTHVGR